MAATTVTHYYQRSLFIALAGEKLSLKSANKRTSGENIKDIWETTTSTNIKQHQYMRAFNSNFMLIERMRRMNAL